MLRHPARFHPPCAGLFPPRDSAFADEAGNTDDLRRALARLWGASAPLRRADRQELQARLALRQDDLAGARVATMQAAGIRQEAFDYRGMARALAVATLAAERAGDSEAAANLYLRAGRSAAAQSDSGTARPWLERVLGLTRDADTEAAARAAGSAGIGETYFFTSSQLPSRSNCWIAAASSSVSSPRLA